MIKEATIWNAYHITSMWHKMMKATETEHDGVDLEQFFIDLVVMIKSPEYGVFVAVNDENIPVGFISGKVGAGDWHTYLTGTCEFLYVEEAYRGDNVSGKLIDTMHKFFEEAQVKDEQFITRYEDKLLKVWERKGYKPYQVIFRKEI